MNNDYFHLPTCWRVRGVVEDVYDIITRPSDFPRWWPRVYLAVKEIAPGDERGIGRVVEVLTRGLLPYTLTWRARATASDKPHSLTLKASGDLEGEGRWHFTQDGEWVNIHYDWKLVVNKAWMRAFYFMLKFAFAANHRWAMREGERGLINELSRRRNRQNAL